MTALVIASGAIFAVTGSAALAAGAARSAPALSAPNPPAQPLLQASPGEFVSVPIYKVLDTRYGTGEPGGAAQLAAGAAIAVTVTGADGVPSDATSVVVNVNAINASAAGYLTDYDSDNADPDVASVGVRPGVNTNQTDTVPVSSTGTISFANHTSGSLDIAVSVTGYYTGGSDTSAGDTYRDAAWNEIVDTTTGLGTSEAPIPAGGSITVQVGGEGGIESGADTAVVQLTALNATATGFLTAYAAGSSDPGVSVLSYDSDLTYANLAYAPLSSAGQLTIANHGSAPVDLTVVTRGYFMPPAYSTVGGEYDPVGPVTVYGAGGGTALAGNSSVTFQVAGTAGLPATGLNEVAEHVIVTSPAASGSLDVYRGGATDSHQATMSFLADDNTDVGYQDSILSQVSPTGEETVTNESPGALTLQVVVVGMFFQPEVPAVPSYLQAAETYSTTPVLSGIVQDATGDDPSGEIFLFGSSGNPIGGSPTAVGQVSSGERVTWDVPDGNLADGSTYQWYMEACDQGVCSAPSPTQTFTVDTSAAPPAPTATNTVTLPESAVTSMDGISDSGACSGSDCPVTAGGAALNVGYDGTSNWASGLKLNLSAIPACSTVISATLQLTRSGCLTGTSCSASALDVYEADSDVTQAATGPELAAAAIPDPTTATAPAAQGTWDITGIVQGWTAGDDPNDGLVIQAPSTGTEGVSYYSPASGAGASSLPQVTIGYIPPAVPAAPASLTVTPGDGGAEVTWSEPSWNYTDDTDDSSATPTYTVQALTSTGTVAASQTAYGQAATITGLTNGVPYTVTVTGTNPIGTSAAATSAAVTPEAVPGGSAQYISAVTQYLNSQDAVTSGAAPTAAAALDGASMSSADMTMLSDEDQSDSSVSAALSVNSQQMTDDTTTLSGTLAVLSPDGTTVSVYASSEETWTTVDSSSGTAESIPGSADGDYIFSFADPGSTPQLTGQADADAALLPINTDGDETALSDTLDAATIADDDSDAPAPLPVTSTGQFVAGPDSVTGGGCGSGPCQASAATWALNHICPNDPKRCDNGFSEDCTDFVSRALRFGGGFPEIWSGNRYGDYSDKDSWYQFHGSFMTKTAYNWAGEPNLARYEKRYGGASIFYKYGRKQGSVNSAIGSGALIFASHLHGGRFANIYHVGMVTKVSGDNLYITQHSTDFKNRPLWASTGSSWFNDNHHYLVKVYVANPDVIMHWVKH